ncbi:hypothetical protein B296_00040161 [Ensete ventricosum]|uniref:Uncharacterized protein n=1 Tax=Ensete ventricosum TaxID=4639 RepID=A0A426ZLP9_ENSVE|nr:hypothetical protein B296_00040161 [Ensete ventricosum]
MKVHMLQLLLSFGRPKSMEADRKGQVFWHFELCYDCFGFPYSSSIQYDKVTHLLCDSILVSKMKAEISSRSISIMISKHRYCENNILTSTTRT